MVEHSAVNRVVVGSSPTRGVFLSDTLDTPSGDNTRLHGQAVKTSPFHGGNTGSNPAVTSLKRTTSVYDVVFLLYNLQIKYIVNLCNIRNICCTHFIIF